MKNKNRMAQHPEKTPIKTQHVLPQNHKKYPSTPNNIILQNRRFHKEVLTIDFNF
jgi:hypothetical protein